MNRHPIHKPANEGVENPVRPKPDDGGEARRALLAGVWHLISLGLLVGGILLVARFTPWGNFMPHLEAFVHQHRWLALLAYPFLCALCNLLLLPGGVLSLAAGYFFGVWWGFPVVLIGTTIGAAAAFLVTRKWARRFVEKRLLHNARWQAFDTLIERKGWRIVLLSQLNPLFPTSLINYFFGATRMDFRTSVFWIAVGQAPGLFLYVFLGSIGRLGFQTASGTVRPGALDIALWAGGVVFAAASTLALGIVAARLWNEARRGLREPETTIPTSEPAA